MIELIKYEYRGQRFRYKVDPGEINYIIENIDEGDIVVDIGAHKGGFLYWMQKGVKQGGKVYAFEPQKKLFKYLTKIFELKKWENVVIENLGLSSSEEEVSFFVPKTSKGDSPGARIDFLKDGKEYDKSKIQTTTLDKYFFDRQIYPNLIKIDVEGHEKQVLNGGINLLKKAKPKILMECENRHLAEGDIFDVFNVLINLGYKAYFFDKKNLRPIKDFNIDIHQKIGEGRFWEAEGYVNNFVFEST